MTKDMTNGKPLSLILKFCLPMVGGNVLQQFYNLADTAIVGRCMDSNALAAIGATSAICFLVVGFSTGLCTGLSIPVAQRYGANDLKNMRHFMSNAVYISGIVSLILTISTILTCRPLLELMQTPPEIIEHAQKYLLIIFAGLTATILYNLVSAFLRAMGDSVTPLIFLAVSSVLNIGLDFLMIPPFGTAGAALATVIAQGVSALCCLVFMYKHFPILHFQKEEWSFSGGKCQTLCGISLPMAFQFSITAVGSLIMQTAINRLGISVIAGVTAAMKIQNIVIGPMESLGITMATYCSQNLGAIKIDRIREGLRKSLFVTLIYACFAYVFTFVLGKYFVYLFVSTKEPNFLSIMDYAVKYLRISGIFYPVLSVLFVLRNSLQGMGFSFLPMSAGILELVARSFAAWVMVEKFGFVGICLASPFAWILADVLLISASVYALVSLPKKIHALPKTA